MVKKLTVWQLKVELESLHKLKFYPSILLLMIKMSQSAGEKLDSYCKINFWQLFSCLMSKKESSIHQILAIRLKKKTKRNKTTTTTTTTTTTALNNNKHKRITKQNNGICQLQVICEPIYLGQFVVPFQTLWWYSWEFLLSKFQTVACIWMNNF